MSCPYVPEMSEEEGAGTPVVAKSIHDNRSPEDSTRPNPTLPSERHNSSSLFVTNNELKTIAYLHKDETTVIPLCFISEVDTTN